MLPKGELNAANHIQETLLMKGVHLARMSPNFVLFEYHTERHLEECILLSLIIYAILNT